MRVAFFQATSCHGDRTRTPQVCQAWSSQVSITNIMMKIITITIIITIIIIIKCVKLDRARSAKALEFVIFILAYPSVTSIFLPPPAQNLGSLFFPVSYPGSDNSLLQVWASARTLLGHSQAEHTAVQQLRFTFSVVKVTITIIRFFQVW